ncbi:sensor histidine kinase [Candidatus Enterococcus mansonii]|uniref:Sensor histidine kinase NatK-like C-terminal domain-containing protein n=1 Tax=Candidatus Enterococcus mansonii TaxID=1834181 RepID=A0A242CEJ0_9ENTE|nr:GHKL domain-containing protein [Enterococcus sp. 4G2_DIV0659]OTO08579.1 hypothetical protein A5880_001579 [Enterococcus sp. 4G2_DIV0659]
MLSFFLMGVDSFFSIALFIFPIYLFLNKKIKKVCILAGVSSFAFYILYANLLVPYFFSSGGIALSAISLYSIITLCFLAMWYLLENKRVDNWIESILIVHCEVIGSWLLVSKLVVFILQSYSLFIHVAIIILVSLFMLVSIFFNIKILNYFGKRKQQTLLICLLFFSLIGLYMYDIVLPHLVKPEIIIDGNIESTTKLSMLKSSLSLFILFVIIAVVIGGIILKDRLATRKIKEQQEREVQLENYICAMESMQTDIQKIHHDYKNLVIAIGGYLQNEDTDISGLRKYYKDILKLEKDTSLKTVHLSKLKKIKILELKGLLVAKIIQATQKSININMEVEDEISSLPMDNVDLTRIVGNLLDNAIEASLECQNPEIRIAFIVLDKYTLIIIENTTWLTTLTTKNFSEYGVSSKGKDRGIGLSNVFELLENYPLIELDTTLEQSKFRQTIIFPN